MPGFELGTLIIALLGLILSVILGIEKLNSKRRKISVANALNLIAILDGEYEAVYSLACVNNGERVVRIESYGIALPNGMNIGFHDDHPEPVTFPAVLNDGQDIGVIAYGRQLIPLFRVANYTDEVIVRGFFRSTSGKIFKAKKIKIRISDLYKPRQ